MDMKQINIYGHTVGGAGNLYAANATNSGAQGLGEFGSWIPTLALVAAAAVVIGVLVTSLS